MTDFKQPTATFTTINHLLEGVTHTTTREALKPSLKFHAVKEMGRPTCVKMKN
jgi:hypothetical protein